MLSRLIRESIVLWPFLVWLCRERKSRAEALARFASEAAYAIPMLCRKVGDHDDAIRKGSYGKGRILL
jgi:hypothetical protein